MTETLEENDVCSFQSKAEVSLKKTFCICATFQECVSGSFYYEFWCVSLFPPYSPHTNHETVIVPLTSVAASSSLLYQINPLEEIQYRDAQTHLASLYQHLCHCHRDMTPGATTMTHPVYFGWRNCSPHPCFIARQVLL